MVKQIWDDGDALKQVWKEENNIGRGIMGKRRRRKKMKRTKFEISRGDLTSLGYYLSKSARSRHIALGKAVKKYGYTATLRKLTFLKGPAKLTKTQKRKIAADMRWLKEKYGSGRK